MNHWQACYLLPLVLLAGCKPQSAPPMSRQYFEAARKMCGLAATTYTYREGFLLDEPLIDFTKETDGRRAHECFTKALEKLDRAATKHGVTSIGYIWEYKF